MQAHLEHFYGFRLATRTYLCTCLQCLILLKVFILLRDKISTLPKRFLDPQFGDPTHWEANLRLPTTLDLASSGFSLGFWNAALLIIGHTRISISSCTDTCTVRACLMTDLYMWCLKLLCGSSELSVRKLLQLQAHMAILSFWPARSTLFMLPWTVV